ncbi:type II toxin-antitoxin system VapC family toxin [Euzebya sp.]|uniref:type II toxin-antitoxin system VapC family toxin n=1 Tax=Euzebya sp. TaxID=1971409 RepID=UPI003512AD23
MIALDTHVVAWLYESGAEAVPARIAARLDTETVRIAPPVVLELTYLHEIGRLTVPAATMLAHLSARLDVAPEDLSAADLFAAAIPLSWTRDSFDRLICAHSAALGIDLATKDETIHAHHDRAVW